MQPNRKKTTDDSPKKKTLHTVSITDEQAEKLDAWLDKHLWAPFSVNYAKFAYKGPDVNVVAYSSGKVVIQGKGTEDFVQFVLEPEITGFAQLGYDEALHPEWYELHAGVDESGKGDLFGPLVSACVVADGDAVREWVAADLRESKKVSSDEAVLNMARKIKATKNVAVKVLRGHGKIQRPLHKIRAKSQQAFGVVPRDGDYVGPERKARAVGYARPVHETAACPTPARHSRLRA